MEIESKRPEILVLDEPMNHLDKDARLRLINFIELYKKEMIIIVDTHEDELRKRVDYIIEL